MQKLITRLTICLLLISLAGCVKPKGAPSDFCDLYEPMPSVGRNAISYWESLERSIVEKEEKGERLDSEEELFKALITTVAKQAKKFELKQCYAD